MKKANANGNLIMSFRKSATYRSEIETLELLRLLILL